MDEKRGLRYWRMNRVLTVTQIMAARRQPERRTQRREDWEEDLLEYSGPLPSQEREPMRRGGRNPSESGPYRDDIRSREYIDEGYSGQPRFGQSRAVDLGSSEAEYRAPMAPTSEGSRYESELNQQQDRMESSRFNSGPRHRHVAETRPSRDNREYLEYDRQSGRDYEVRPTQSPYSEETRQIGLPKGGYYREEDYDTPAERQPSGYEQDRGRPLRSEDVERDDHYVRPPPRRHLESGMGRGRPPMRGGIISEQNRLRMDHRREPSYGQDSDISEPSAHSGQYLRMREPEPSASMRHVERGDLVRRMEPPEQREEMNRVRRDLSPYYGGKSEYRGSEIGRGRYDDDDRLASGRVSRVVDRRDYREGDPYYREDFNVPIREMREISLTRPTPSEQSVELRRPGMTLSGNQNVRVVHDHGTTNSGLSERTMAREQIPTRRFDDDERVLDSGRVITGPGLGSGRRQEPSARINQSGSIQRNATYSGVLTAKPPTTAEFPNVRQRTNLAGGEKPKYIDPIWLNLVHHIRQSWPAFNPLRAAKGPCCDDPGRRILWQLCHEYYLSHHDLDDEYGPLEGTTKPRNDELFCDNWGCGAPHSNSKCPKPARCKGCGVEGHFWANCRTCKGECSACQGAKHWSGMCHMIENGTNMKRRPGSEVWSLGPQTSVFQDSIYPFWKEVWAAMKGNSGKPKPGRWDY